MQLNMIQDYYGRVLESKNDLKTTACCSAESVPPYLQKIIGKIHLEVREKFYGCGVPIPSMLAGCSILDLGSGTGRDCFALAALAGEDAQVVGVDMTAEQVAVAKQYLDYHRDVFKQQLAELDFRTGYIEDLRACGVDDETVDLVVSNCVINLSPDKRSVFSEIFRVLKPGAELYFSDVFCERRLPPEFSEDPVLLGECLGGALYEEDFRRMMAEVGFNDYRELARSPIEITNPEIAKKLGHSRFFSATVRAFKMPFEDRQEDYGHTVRYDGGIKYHPHGFSLDHNHYFETARAQQVSANTAKILSQSRYAKHFSVFGGGDQHFGRFDSRVLQRVPDSDVGSDGGCCP